MPKSAPYCTLATRAAQATCHHHSHCLSRHSLFSTHNNITLSFLQSSIISSILRLGYEILLRVIVLSYKAHRPTHSFAADHIPGPNQLQSVTHIVPTTAIVLRFR